MQIILVSDHLATARTIHIMPRHVLMAVASFLFLLFSTSALFSWASVHFRLPLVQGLILSLQQREAAQTQSFVHNNLQMLATRVGELQARVVQIDSMSERLEAMLGEPAPQQAAKASAEGGPLLPMPVSEAALNKEIERLGQAVDERSEQLSVLESRLLDERTRRRFLPTTRPIADAPIGSGFGPRIDPFAHVSAMHEGLDFVADVGTPVVAAAGGVVAVAEYHPEFGNMIEVDHGGGIMTRYAHLSKLLVVPGQIVRRGTGIALSGNTGRSSGPHMHFEVRVNGVAQNPMAFLRLGTNGQVASAR